jgi:hypothetical protein
VGHVPAAVLGLLPEAVRERAGRRRRWLARRPCAWPDLKPDLAIRKTALTIATPNSHTVKYTVTYHCAKCPPVHTFCYPFAYEINVLQSDLKRIFLFRHYYMHLIKIKNNRDLIKIKCSNCFVSKVAIVIGVNRIEPTI